MSLFSNEALSEFSDLDYEVYNFILKNSEKIAYMTIREVANEAHVSTTTITRFCRKLNCDGFSEFKVRYKLESAKNIVTQKKYDSSSILDFLERANTETFQKQLDKISSIIASKKHVIFLGVGNSGLIADYATRYFCNVGIFSTGVNNPTFPINLEVPSETIIITLSVEGEVDVLIQNSEILRKSKATIVSITNSKNSTLAKMSDYNISYYIQRELAYESSWIKVDITSQIPAIYIIEALAKLSILKKQDNINVTQT
ncbi:MurR/RpiR family transcriptional regulator [Clostridium sp. SHJSY1]|uniref:MurR/RpiR family transcriptional regulator n=1 Tax=Clostridium sp. SHJSY1 TaxID=2942483 RepID=UPI002875BB66|nr:MurR/RpiR family transcriptional regulator [Clostridium sp. SHJSY1]MDS0526106.1 MurR/RpiR family transcriptional regulator [Clostridium sp. SHJSY1]